MSPGSLTVTPRADDHGQQPDQGLRRGDADADRQLLGLRQRRHLGQPDDPAHAHDDGDDIQPSRATYTITASGAVDPNYTISYVAGTLTINQDASTTVRQHLDHQRPFGQAVTLTATVTANAPGSGTPTGSVDFFDTTTGDDLGRISLSGGKATLSIASLPPGANAIRVSYSGDSNFLASSTSTSTITINQSIIVLDPTAGGALSISGNASIKLSGGVYVDSSSSSALSASGNAEITASVIDVHGGVQKSGNATFNPAPVTKAATVPDPLAGLPVPSTTGVTNYGCESLSGNSKATIKPGIYSQIAVSGNASLTLDAGLYIIEGGGFQVSGNASVTGTGVTLYNAGSKFPNSGGTFGAITLSGNGTISLTPATTGSYAGILFLQPAANTQVLTFSGNAMSGMTGTIYAPSAQLVASGNAQVSAAIIVDTMTLSGNAVANIVTSVRQCRDCFRHEHAWRRSPGTRRIATWWQLPDHGHCHHK